MLLYGIAVCEGISKAFKFLCDRCNIDSILITGEAYDSGNDKTSYGGHAWNIVFIDTIPYHIDVTFDYTLSGKNLLRYDYYLLSDTQIQYDHLYKHLLVCDTDYDYYKAINCYAGCKSELQALVRNKLSPKTPLVIKIPNLNNDIKAVTESMMTSVSSCISLVDGFQSYIMMTYNRSRMIFQFEICS